MCRQSVEEGRPFDVVVLDLTIVGGMGGKEAMPKIRALCPTIATMITNGYSDDDVMAQYKAHGFDAMLEKPFTGDQFTLAVDAARAQRGARTT